jgi:NAD(P)-dependent dehydrogenase (short-subunit alcohol dehydrogenase family)
MTQSDMHGKICLVTGASSGIGKATAAGLAKLGATVVMVCRDQARGEAALAEVRTSSGNDAVTLLLADLSSQVSIRQLAHAFQATYPHLHVFINNAGVGPWRRSVTVDGIETTFAVNYLAPFLLTHLLLDRLTASAPARIINVTSAMNSPLDFDDLQREKHFDPMQVYSQSKFALILFTYELARRLQETGVTVNCLSPGVVATNLSRDYPLAFRLMTRLFFSRPEKGAQTSLYLASSPEVEGVTGKYFDRGKEARTSSKTYDAAASQRLWQVSTELTQLAPVDA